MYAGERFKCAKFINSLRPEVKMMVNYHGMHNFAQLTNMRRIFHEDQREKVAFYRNANASHGKKKKHVTHSCAKLYSSLLGQYGVNVWIHDFDDAKEESNKVASKAKHCFKINTRLLQQTKPCFKINSRSSLASKQSVFKTSKALVIDYQAM